eukprot:g7363.t1
MCRSSLLILLVSLWGSLLVAAECPPPPEGLWIYKAYEPVIDFMQEQGIAYGNLSLSGTKNVYTGLFYGRSVILPGQTTSNIHFVFDPEDCIVYGTNTLFIPGAHDTIIMRWDGDKQMAGLFDILLGGILTLPYHSMYVFDYVGPWDEKHPALSF